MYFRAVLYSLGALPFLPMYGLTRWMQSARLICLSCLPSSSCLDLCSLVQLLHKYWWRARVQERSFGVPQCFTFMIFITIYCCPTCHIQTHYPCIVSFCRKAGLILSQLGDLSGWCHSLLQEPKISLQRTTLKFLACRYSEIKPYGFNWLELSRDLKKTCEEQMLNVLYNDYGDKDNWAGSRKDIKRTSSELGRRGVYRSRLLGFFTWIFNTPDRSLMIALLTERERECLFLLT